MRSTAPFHRPRESSLPSQSLEGDDFYTGHRRGLPAEDAAAAMFMGARLFRRDEIGERRAGGLALQPTCLLVEAADSVQPLVIAELRLGDRCLHHLDCLVI